MLLMMLHMFINYSFLLCLHVLFTIFLDFLVKNSILEWIVLEISAIIQTDTVPLRCVGLELELFTFILLLYSSKRRIF